MSARLSLRVMKFFGGQGFTTDVVADVLPLSDEAKTTYRGIAIPAGEGNDLPREVEVVAGRYLVQAYLPSGELIRQKISVAEGESAAVELRGSYSSHEWLGLHHLLDASWSREAFRGGLESALWPAPRATLLAVNADSKHQTGAFPIRIDAESRDVLLRAIPDVELALDLPPRDSDGESFLFKLDDIGRWFVAGGPTLRYFVVIERSGRLDLVVVPLPWRSVDDRSASAVEVATQGDPSNPVTVAVRDPAFGALLGYLSNGPLSSARQLVNGDSRTRSLALSALYHKVENPYAAAAGAYVLTQGYAFEESQEWHYWIDNLANRFPQLPDGPIVRAALHLQRKYPDLESVGASFLEGFARGLPVYTAVFRLLFDGLTMFCGDSRTRTPALEDALSALTAVAGRLDVRQSFTTIRLGGG